MLDINYAERFGTDESEKACDVFRNPISYEEGRLIGPESDSIKSMYQQFE